MNATILNTNFEAVGLIDTYKSFIWTDRFDEYGDFEIYIPIPNQVSSLIQKGYYLWNAESEHVMIIESIIIESDIEEGACLAIKGKSLESLLSRRIIWRQKLDPTSQTYITTKTTFSADDNGVEPNLQNGINTLLTENVINPIVAARKIPNFIFEESTDEKITSLTFEAQYFGEDLYSTISSLCKENEIGFKITLNDNNQFVFKLYAGVDHSYEQLTNPYVVFSPDHDNIFNTNFLDSDESLKNVTLVAGESEYNESTEETSYTTYVLGFSSGIDRREIYTDATSLSTDDGDGGTLSAERYQAHLKQKGIDTLIENTTLTAFEGEIDYTGMYKYGVDYYMGDIVQIANEYGQEGQAYISEFVISCDESGFSMYPTFKTIQKGEYE